MQPLLSPLPCNVPTAPRNRDGKQAGRGAATAQDHTSGLGWNSGVLSTTGSPRAVAPASSLKEFVQIVE